jgi:uncharacterized ferritin-like protein (DUF455 family)
VTTTSDQIAAALTLQRAALEVLLESDPEIKAAQSQALFQAIAAEQLIDADRTSALPIDIPGRPAKPALVAPRQLQQRKLSSEEGRAALLHAIAHIEFNAINLAWDAVYRFADMPKAFYIDWASVAADEARHFSMLQGRLRQLGWSYGDFPAHNGLWDMACKTRHCVTTRMALVPRVLEARGLDVTPGMIAKLDAQGDRESVAILHTILAEEVRHVHIGSHWFAWLCQNNGLDAPAHFRYLVDTIAPGMLVLPFNDAARLQAGFDLDELAMLKTVAANGERKNQSQTALASKQI